MTLNHIYKLIIKGFGVFILFESIDYLFLTAKDIIDFNQNQDAQFDFLINAHTYMNILKFALYSVIGLVSIFKVDKIKSFLFKNELLEVDVIDQSEHNRYPFKNFFILAIRICGLIFVVLALSQIISGIFAAIFLPQSSKYDDSRLIYFILGILSGLILPICELIFGFILIKTPNWLRKLIGIESL